jgi:hypothetical protein
LPILEDGLNLFSLENRCEFLIRKQFVNMTYFGIRFKEFVEKGKRGGEYNKPVRGVETLVLCEPLINHHILWNEEREGMGGGWGRRRIGILPLSIGEEG